MSAWLLTAFEDGTARLLDPKLVRHTRRGSPGVGITAKDTDGVSKTLVAALMVTEDDHVLVTTEAGKFVRVAVADIPKRKRRACGARIAKGTVTAVAVAPRPEITAEAVQTPVTCKDSVLLQPGRVALRPGEDFSAALLFHAPKQGKPCGKPITPRAEWAETSVAKSSRVWCGHCAVQLADPHEFYEHVDSEHGAVS